MPEAPGRCLLVSAKGAAGCRRAATLSEQLCQPLPCDDELLTEISPGRWRLLVTLSEAAKYARLASAVITRCVDRYVARVCHKTDTCSWPVVRGLDTLLHHRLATAEIDRNIGLAGR